MKNAIGYEGNDMDIDVAKNRLAQIRVRKSLTQAQVEEATDISQSDLSKYENGTARISVEKASRLADYYDVSLDEIFMRDVKHELAIKENEQLSLVVQIEKSSEIRELYKLLIENNFVASLGKRSSTSN